MENEAVIFSVLARVARPEILKKYGPKSCIASTRIIIEVLSRYGIGSKPLAVRTVVTRSEDAITLGSIDGTIGKPPEWTGSLGGHLIAAVPDQTLVIDASLDQVPNEQFDIVNLPCPFIAPVTAEFLAGRESAYFLLPGCGIIYEPHLPVPDAVLAAPEWKQRQPRAEVVDRICAHIERMKPISEGKFKRRYREAHEFAEQTKMIAAEL